ncbi:hypothetical protein SDC9_56983 [bioreactor metagenome]|uniref:Type I restriction modification DNA specificity domain-containing protein n=1 Tax=bioreactor metagenome TaxID=1076179 RepID=A0A644X3J8_9ZZZZ
MSFSEWREVKLEEIIEIEMGQSPKSEFYNQTGEGLPFLQGNRTFGDKYPYFDTYCTENKKIANTNDVIMSVRAPVGDLNIAQTKISLGRGVCAMRLKGEQNSNYLFYLMKHNIKEMINRESGTVFGSVNKKDILGLEVKITNNKFEQKAIAHILSTLDDKIEVNNQINKILEDMAKVIFKQWFVDYEYPNENSEPYKSNGGEMVESELGMIPKGWEVKELGEIIDIIKQGTKPGEHLKDRKYNPIDTLPMKSIAINDFKPYEEAKSSLILFEKYDILIGAMRVYFHRVNLAPYKGITRTTTFVLRSKRIQDVPYNLFLLNMDETIDYAERTSKGSTMPYAVWDNGMSNILVAYSNQELRNKFFQIIQPMLETIMKKSAENEVLIKLRDSLLPKLMSGEIRVPLDEEGDVS